MPLYSWKIQTGKIELLFIWVGQLINFILLLASVFFYFFLGITLESIYFIIVINLYLFIFNLMPVIPLDGGKILRDILINNFGLFLGSSYLRKISYALSFVLIILGMLQIRNNFYNISLLIIGFYTFINLKIDYLEVAFMNIKHIMFRRVRFLKRRIYAARDLVALKSVSLGEILKSMDYDRFHFIYVLDENLKILTILSEQELIDSMIKYSSEITLEEIIEKSNKNVAMN